MINTSSNATKIGSENCPAVSHRKYSCGSPDFLITALELDHETGVLTIYQNPNNCKSIVIEELLKIPEIQDAISKLINNKVDKTYFLHTTNGIQGGGTFESELELTIRPKDAHVDATPEGLSIKKFTEVNTSGTVPSPEQSKKTEEYFLNAKGEWSKLGVLKFKGAIESSTTLTDLDIGDMYIIKDLGNPNGTVVVNGQTFLSTDVIVWDGNKFVDIGQVSVKVNLTLSEGLENNVISNTAGSGVTLTPAKPNKAGLMSAEDKSNLDTLHGRKVVTHISSAAPTETTVIFTYTSIQTGQTAVITPITIPAATKTSAGVMTKEDKIKLENLVSETKVTSVTGAVMSSTSGVISVTRVGSGGNQSVEIPLVDSDRGLAGLMKPADKRRLDELDNDYLQSDWDANDGQRFIRNKPIIISSSDRSKPRGYLVPPSTGHSDENVVLNCLGKWTTIKSSPPITVDADEPTGENAIEGAIWIIP